MARIARYRSKRRPRPPVDCATCNGLGGDSSGPCPTCGRMRARRKDAGQQRRSRPTGVYNRRRRYTVSFPDHQNTFLIQHDPTAAVDNWDAVKKLLTTYRRLTHRNFQLTLVAKIAVEVREGVSPPTAAVRHLAAFGAAESARRGWSKGELTPEQENELMSAYNAHMKTDRAIRKLWSETRALNLAVDQQALVAVAEEYGVNPRTLRKWFDQEQRHHR